MTDFVSGQTVTLSRTSTVNLVTDSRSALVLDARATGEVTSVTKNRIRMRILGNYDITSSYPWSNVNRSYRVSDPVVSVHRVDVEAPNGEKWDAAAVAKSKPRPIGEKPEGDHLDVDDPRIQWIFEDAARVAKNAGHCYAYDDLCNRIGIPGRLRDIRVDTTINGLAVATTVRARSEKEAKALVEEKLGS